MRRRLTDDGVLLGAGATAAILLCLVGVGVLVVLAEVQGETVALRRVICRTEHGLVVLDEVYDWERAGNAVRYLAPDGGGLLVPANAWCMEEPTDARACLRRRDRRVRRGACGDQ